MSSKSFPVFQLPLVTVREVLNSCSLQEVIYLSFCSRKSFNITKAAFPRKRKNITISFNIETKSRIITTCGTEQYTISVSEIPRNFENLGLEPIRIEGRIVPIKYMRNEKYCELFRANHQTGIRSIVEYLMRLFDRPIHQVGITAEKDLTDPKFAVDLIKRHQKSIENVKFECNKSDGTHLAYLFENCKITDSIYLNVKPRYDFRYTFHLNLREITINHAHWVTVRSLIDSSFETLDMKSSKLSSTDLNALLKHWKKDGGSQMKFMKIEMDSIDYDVVQDDLDGKNVPSDKKRIYQNFPDDPIEYSGGFYITRDDGLVGTIIRDVDPAPPRPTFLFIIGVVFIG